VSRSSLFRNSLREAIHKHGRAALIIAATVGGIALVFVGVAGWFGDRLAPGQVADALERHDGLHPGARRAHAKGMCFAGHFDANGQGVALSKAAVFAAGQSAVVGRFSTGGGMPSAPDGRLVFRAMALSISARDGTVWRTGMDSTPIFPVATPQAFVDFQVATRPQADGKPDPAKVAAYLAGHPETQAFNTWLKNNPLPSSFVNSTFNSINAFAFTNAQGQSRFVRWTMVPEADSAFLDKAKLASLGRDFLFDDLVARAARGPLRWHFFMTLAEPGDIVNNATVQWPEHRQRVEVGELVIEHVTDEEDGGCRDINFDPLILPPGIAGSNDPLLAARSAVYASSFRRRAGEGARPSFAAGAAHE
jgi:catalase